MSRAFKVPIQFVNSKITSRVYQAACTHMRNWSSRNEDKNVINITRIYNDEDGKSHFGNMEIELKGSGKEKSSTLPSLLVLIAGDIGYLSPLIPASGVIFRQTPASYLYKWHNAPARQFIVNLGKVNQLQVISIANPGWPGVDLGSKGALEIAPVTNRHKFYYAVGFSLFDL